MCDVLLVVVIAISVRGSFVKPMNVQFLGWFSLGTIRRQPLPL